MKDGVWPQEGVVTVTADVTWEGFATVVLLIVGAASVANMFLTLYKNAMEAKKPHDKHVAMVKEHDQKLLNDWEELETHKKKIADLEKRLMEIKEQNDSLESQCTLLIISIKDLLMHVIDGNNHLDALKVDHGILDRYLTGDLDLVDLAAHKSAHR